MHHDRLVELAVDPAVLLPRLESLITNLTGVVPREDDLTRAADPQSIRLSPIAHTVGPDVQQEAEAGSYTVQSQQAVAIRPGKRGPAMRQGTFALFAGMTLLGVATFTAPASGQRGGATVALPDGGGKQLVESTCAKCHGLNLIVGSWGNTKQGWHDLIGTMVALPKDQADIVTTYLATNFPEKPAPRR